MENYGNTYVRGQLLLMSQFGNEACPSVIGMLRISHRHFPLQDKHA